MLLRIVSMLSKSVERFDKRVQEEKGSYGIEDEDE